MGAIGGLITFDGAPVERTWLSTLAALLARLGPDGELIATSGSVGLVHRAHGTGSIDQSLASLWQSRDGDLLAFDGRLDNGRELADLLELRGTDAGTDSTILLEGLKRFGASFVGRMLGDFALAHWNAATSELTLGRDAAGVRTLYYHHTSTSCAFASDLGSLVRAANVARELDEDYIAAYLACDPDTDQTVYRQVRAVRPAQVVRISIGGTMRHETVWALEPDPLEITYRDDHEYEEQFHTLFADAVRVRLRTSHHVVAELSGGLDSSSVVCMADRLLRSGDALAPSLSTASVIADRSATVDEAHFRSAVEQQCGRERFHVTEYDAMRFSPARDAINLHSLSNLLVTSGWEVALGAHMRERGAHVLLTGMGGDEMFYPSNLPLPGLGDKWTRGHLRELHRELLRWSHAIQEPYIRLLWQSFHEGVMGGSWGPLHAKQWSPPSWMRPRLSRRTRAIRLNQARRLQRYRIPSRRDHAAGYYNITGIIARGARQEFDARQVTYPCLHRPLVEFMHAVPFTQKLRCGESRSLQRRALRSVLPTMVLQRRGKVAFDEASMRSLIDDGAEWQSLLTESCAEARGYIDAREAGAPLRRLLAGLSNECSRPAYSVFVLEAWLRAHSRDVSEPA